MTAFATRTGYSIKRFRSGDEPDLFQSALAIRTDVFIHEQGCAPGLDPDQYDALATHWLLLAPNGDAVATGRLIPKTGAVAKIGRIAVTKAYRGKGLATVLLRDILDAAVEDGYREAVLEAQLYASHLYAKLGFKAEGGAYFDEDNIEHVWMRKQLA